MTDAIRTVLGFDVEPDPLREAPAPATDSPAAPAAGPWMIPLTAIDPAPLYAPARRVARQLRRAFQNKHRTAQLWEPGDPNRFWQLIEADPLARSKPYLCFVVRTEVPLYPHFDAALMQKLEALEASPLASRLAFVLPAVVVGERPAPAGRRLATNGRGDPAARGGLPARSGEAPSPPG